MGGVSHQGPAINGGLVDFLTICVGIVVVLVKLGLRWKVGIRPVFVVGKATVDLLNGSVIMPFASMFGPVLAAQFSYTWLEHFRWASPGSVAVAAGVGLFFLLGELTKLD